MRLWSILSIFLRRLLMRLVSRAPLVCLLTTLVICCLPHSLRPALLQAPQSQPQTISLERYTRRSPEFGHPGNSRVSPAHRRAGPSSPARLAPRQRRRQSRSIITNLVCLLTTLVICCLPHSLRPALLQAPQSQPQTISLERYTRCVAQNLDPGNSRVSPAHRRAGPSSPARLAPRQRRRQSRSIITNSAANYTGYSKDS